MQAAFVNGPGAADDIVVGELPVPVPGPTDVLVRVHAVSANHVDTFVRSGAYATPMPLPFVIGRDLAGTVVEAPDWSAFRPGDPVWCNSLGHGGRQGSWSQYAVVPVDRLYPLPPGADPVRTVAAVHSAATAYLALHVHARVEAGETAVIGGGAGSIGAIAVRLATAAGLRVIATARPADADRVRALGAEAVLDYADPDLSDRIRDLAPAGVDVFWDTSGKTALADAAEVVAPKGRILITAGRQPQPPASLWRLYTHDVSVIGFVISLASVAELAATAARLDPLLAGEGLPVQVSRVLPLADAAEAHRLVEQNVRGRIVVELP